MDVTGMTEKELITITIDRYTDLHQIKILNVLRCIYGSCHVPSKKNAAQLSQVIFIYC